MQNASSAKAIHGSGACPRRKPRYASADAPIITAACTASEYCCSPLRKSQRVTPYVVTAHDVCVHTKSLTGSMYVP